MAVTRSAASSTSTLSTSKVAKNRNKMNNVKTPKLSATETKGEKHKKLVMGSSVRVKRTKAKSPGIRIIAGRIYDSENGKTCHQCRQKTLDFTVSCKNFNGEKQCTCHYCHICLLNRYGEKAEEVAALSCKWKCPFCRGVCNCCKCMKKRGCMPTGRLLLTAKASGYSSVSEMLQLDEVEKPKENGGATCKKRRASDEESAASSKRGRQENGMDAEANSVSRGKSLETKGNKKDNTSTKESKAKATSGQGNDVKGKDKGNATAKKRSSRMNATLTKAPPSRQKLNRSLRRATSNLKPQEKISRKSKIAEHNESDEPTNLKNIRTAAEKTGGEIQLGEDNVLGLQINNSNVELPLPQATEMTKVASLDLPAEDIGHALQFLEFCDAFGEVLDLKKGHSYFFLQELTGSQNTRRRYDFSLERLHIKLLSMIVRDSENGNSSLKARGRNSWLEALEEHISGCSNVPKNLVLACAHLSREGYSKLDGSLKLRILTFLCDEALGTAELRMWIEKKNMEFLQERKKFKKMLLDEEKKHITNLEKEVAKAVLMRNGAPLSIAEHESLVSKIKMAASDHLRHSDMRGTNDSATMRLNPVLTDSRGRKFWKLKSYSGGMDILLQDVSHQDEFTSEEKWFVYDLDEKGKIERYISSYKILLSSLHRRPVSRSTNPDSSTENAAA